MSTVSGHSANELYANLWWRVITTNPLEEMSRNGPVISLPYPVIMELYNPLDRVLTYPFRNANPFFHIAEVVWMLSGSQDVRFIEQFNKRYREYADKGSNEIWGAYGHRLWWQVPEAIALLKDNKESRQVVISMWDPEKDLTDMPHNDRPCNTSIMFRVVGGKLDMLVTNRSNDLVWGAMGANVVYFTYLQELMAREIGVPLGVYRVVSNNLHVYPKMPNYAEIRNEVQSAGYDSIPCNYPILRHWESYGSARMACANYILSPKNKRFDFQWLEDVAKPLMDAYLAEDNRMGYLYNCRDDAWRAAGHDWLIRNSKEERL